MTYRISQQPDPHDERLEQRRAVALGLAHRFLLTRTMWAASLDAGRESSTPFERSVYLVERDHETQRIEVRVLESGVVQSRVIDAAEASSPLWPTRLLSEQVHTGMFVSPGGAAPGIDERTSRVLETRVQRLGRTGYVFGYRTRLGDGVVEVGAAGIRPSSTLGVLVGRRRLLFVIPLLGLGIATATWVAYATRGPWFRQHGSTTSVFWLTLLASIGVAWWVGAWSLVPEARKHARPRVALALTALALLANALVWNLHLPSVDRAREDLAHGRLNDAEDEALALVKLPRDVADAHEVLDAVHLRRIERGATIGIQQAIVTESWFTEAAERAAQVRLFELTDARIAECGDNSARRYYLAGLVANLDQPRAERYRGRADLIEARRAFESASWEPGVTNLENAARRLGIEATGEVGARAFANLLLHVCDQHAQGVTTPGTAPRYAVLAQADDLVPLLDRIVLAANLEPPSDYPAFRALVQRDAARSFRAGSKEQRPRFGVGPR